MPDDAYSLCKRLRHAGGRVLLTRFTADRALRRGMETIVSVVDVGELLTAVSIPSPCSKVHLFLLTGASCLGGRVAVEEVRRFQRRKLGM